MARSTKAAKEVESSTDVDSGIVEPTSASASIPGTPSVNEQNARSSSPRPCSQPVLLLTARSAPQDTSPPAPGAPAQHLTSGAKAQSENNESRAVYIQSFPVAKYTPTEESISLESQPHLTEQQESQPHPTEQQESQPHPTEQQESQPHPTEQQESQRQQEMMVNTVTHTQPIAASSAGSSSLLHNENSQLRKQLEIYEQQISQLEEKSKYLMEEITRLQEQEKAAHCKQTEAEEELRAEKAKFQQKLNSAHEEYSSTIREKIEKLGEMKADIKQLKSELVQAKKEQADSRLAPESVDEKTKLIDQLVSKVVKLEDTVRSLKFCSKYTKVKVVRKRSIKDRFQRLSDPGPYLRSDSSGDENIHCQEGSPAVEHKHTTTTLLFQEYRATDGGTTTENRPGASRQNLLSDFEDGLSIDDNLTLDKEIQPEDTPILAQHFDNVPFVVDLIKGLSIADKAIYWRVCM